MNHEPIPTQPAPSFDAAREAYAGALLREAVRLLARRRPAGDIDDIASMLVLAFLAKAATIMAQYPDASVYARIAVKRTGISYDRHERAQRGQGVRLRREEDGSVAAGRTVLSGNAPAGTGQLALFDLIGSREPAMDDAIVERLDGAADLAVVLAGVGAADRTLLLMVDGVGYTVSEIADLVGQRRETLSRRLARVRRQVDANQALMILSPAG